MRFLLYAASARTLDSPEIFVCLANKNALNGGSMVIYMMSFAGDSVGYDGGIMGVQQPHTSNESDDRNHSNKIFLLQITLHVQQPSSHPAVITP